MDSRKRAEGFTRPPTLALKDSDTLPEGARVLGVEETITGEILDLRMARGAFFGDRVSQCPVVTFRELDPETGEPLGTWDLWLWHQVPRQQFREKAPQRGDTFHLKRLEDGSSDTYGSYVSTFLTMEGDAAQFGWDEDTPGEYEPEVDPETGEILEPERA